MLREHRGYPVVPALLRRLHIPLNGTGLGGATSKPTKALWEHTRALEPMIKATEQISAELERLKLNIQAGGAGIWALKHTTPA